MALPFYVSPEQFMKDKWEYARKGISKSRPLVVLEYRDGIAFTAENTSATLHKVSEIYDRLALAGVGLYNEFETLRMHGIRQADLQGYTYSREDVTARALANSYSQILGQIFTAELKPFEVEILVAQVGEEGQPNEIYHIRYDGTLADAEKFVAMGGQAEALAAYLEEHFSEGLALEEAVKLGVRTLREIEKREIMPKDIEAAVLDRTRPRRKFRRLDDREVGSFID